MGVLLWFFPSRRFWAGPVAVLVSNLRMAPWTREKISNGVFCAINFCCEAVLLVSLPPSAPVFPGDLNLISTYSVLSLYIGCFKLPFYFFSVHHLCRRIFQNTRYLSVIFRSRCILCLVFHKILVKLRFWRSGTWLTRRNNQKLSVDKWRVMNILK